MLKKKKNNDKFLKFYWFKMKDWIKIFFKVNKKDLEIKKRTNSYCFVEHDEFWEVYELGGDFVGVLVRKFEEEKNILHTKDINASAIKSFCDYLNKRIEKELLQQQLCEF